MNRIELLKEKAKSTPIIDIIDRLTPGLKWRNKGVAKVTCCPFHQEKTPSFHVYQKEGKEFYKCQGCGASGDVISYVSNIKECSFVAALEIITGESVHDPNSPEYEITKKLKAQKKYPIEDGYFRVFDDIYFYYDYKDQLESCKIKYLIVDSEGSIIKKSFSQHLIKNNSIDFHSSLNKLPNTLYNLTQIVSKNKEGKTIFVVEGEKDCNTLIYKGLVATTPRESGEWTEEMVQVFAGADVVVIPDTGEAGSKRANIVIAAIEDIVKSLKVCYAPGLADLGDNKDITDWFEVGNTKQQLLEHIKFFCLDLKNKNELQQDYHGVYYLKTEKIDGEEIDVKKYITNFQVISAEHINNIDEGQPSYQLSLKNIFNEVIEVNIEHESFIEVSNFNKSLKHMNFDFKGNSTMLKTFRLWLNYFVTKRTISCSINGTREFNNEYLLVTEHGAMNSKGEINKTIKASNVLRPCDLPLVETINKYSLEELNKYLFSWNKYEIVNIQLGSAFAYAMVHHFINNGLKLHFSLVAGEAGSGKSTSIESVIMPLSGLSDEFYKKSCANSSFYTMTRNLGSTNLPVFYDEYKPSQWAGKLQYKANEISNILRSLYDRSAAERGNGHEIVQYNVFAPLFLIGEETFADEEGALFERSAISFLTREGKELPGARSSMEYLKNNKTLIMQLGKLLYMTSLGLTNEEFKQIYSEALTECNEFSSMLSSDRVYNSLVNIVTGFKLFNKACAAIGVAAVEIEIKQLAIFFKDHCQSGNERTLSEVEKFFAAIDEMYEGVPYSRVIGYNPNGHFYHLNLKQIYSDINNFDIKNVLGYDVITPTNLKKQLKAKGWLLFDGKSKPQRVIGEEKLLRGYSIKADELRKLNLGIFS
ncbi:CHC2 zinc finger domain-containing protein [Clostridium perfringens]|uniref:Zinc finger CHC2-type domain-containing protein n=1 Tax=Clostridium perfringens TaxID=1502 RepID=A0AAW9I6J8_CLOPF|nr:CHC2 zinc finger domain-containing protein [Clostridium perfringens]MBI6105884.1 hypothetical protein [Clostridium perfringens]MDZ4910046.1 hypothetical protein [Clostridium perfringens]MDZ5055471.1 hypothetical protein [Clostridium perfringens]